MVVGSALSVIGPSQITLSGQPRELTELKVPANEPMATEAPPAPCFGLLFSVGLSLLVPGLFRKGFGTGCDAQSPGSPD